MLIPREDKESLNTLLRKIKLLNNQDDSSPDKEAKIEQILAYLEIIHSSLKKYSVKREITLIDCGAGNCYLSFLVYYFYTVIHPRNIRIYCIDTNRKLMKKSEGIASDMGFKKMVFESGDILDFSITGPVELVYSLHACDFATDKSLYLGLSHGAKNILSVSCCQHSLKKHLKMQQFKGITKHQVFKDRMTYMVGDSLRALLLEMEGYKADIFKFVSSRHTEKNIMIRASLAGFRRDYDAHEEYTKLAGEFHVRPELEHYLSYGKLKKSA